MDWDFICLPTFIHYFLHLGFPAILAFIFFNKPKGKWLKSYIILLLTLLIDLDHLLATPIFDANRCSIGFHLLHSYITIALYIIMLFFPKTRLIAIGLVLHIATDLLDCWMM